MGKYLLEVHGWTKNDGESKAINDVNYFKKIRFYKHSISKFEGEKALYLLTKFPYEIKELSEIIVVQFTGGNCKSNKEK